MTSNPPTEQKLDEIEARANAATPGPWDAYQYGGDSLIEIAADLEDTGCGYSARRTVCRFDEEPLDNDPAHREWTAEEDWAQVQADAAYIAAMSPETAKALIAEVRRLRDRVAELEGPAVEARAALAALCYDLEDPGSNAFGALYLISQATVGVDAPKDDASLALGRHARQVLHMAADMADPEEPEVSFFGGMVGPAVAAWLRMLADRPAAAVPAAVVGGEPGTNQ